MSGLQLLDQSLVAQLNIPSADPSGSVGIDLTTNYPHMLMRPDKWLVTAIVTSATTDLFIWGLVPGGVQDDPSDDVWSRHNDRYGRIVAGKIGTGLTVGNHSFVVPDLGIYARVYFQKTAGAVDVRITPILSSKRGS